jgi:hypothetical protein
MEPVMTMMSGTCVHVLAPNLGPAPTLHEIAWALAHINRFNGHLIKPVSVAKHSIALSLLVTQEHRVRALLHDASEAVLGDVVKPLKMTENFGPYRLIEKLWQLRIYDELGGLAAHSDDDVDPPEMVRLDMALVRLEARFMGTDSLWRGVRSLTEHWDIDLDEDQTTVVEEFYIRNDYKAASDIAAWWEDLVQWNMEREAR